MRIKIVPRDRKDHFVTTIFRLDILKNLKNANRIPRKTLERLLKSRLITNDKRIELSNLGESFVSKLANA